MNLKPKKNQRQWGLGEIQYLSQTKIPNEHSIVQACCPSLLPCPLSSLLLKLMCSKWNMFFKWVTSRGRRYSLFPPQIGRVKILLSQLLSHHGGLSKRKRIIDLRSFCKETHILGLFRENVPCMGQEPQTSILVLIYIENASIWCRLAHLCG